MDAELLTIGAELLQGRVLNTNAQYLSRELTLLNFSVTHHSVCNDHVKEIKALLDRAINRSQLIILTGGLGPTPDDVTREAVAEYFQSELVFNKNQYQHVIQFFKKLGKKPSPITKRECFFPKVGKPILNQYGIALGFYIAIRGRLIICLPGVPREMVNLFERQVKRIINSYLGARTVMKELNVSMMGIDEAGAMKKFPNRFFNNSQFSFGSYPMDGRLVFRFRSKDASVIRRIKNFIGKNFKSYIYSFSDAGIEEVISNLASSKKKTVSVAESCTGGFIAKRLTDIAGASRFFIGGITAYSNQAKLNMLGVNRGDLLRCGAVSKEIARGMALGVRRALKADIGISVTGIAGPEGGTRIKPVGLVWMGVSTSTSTRAYQFKFTGGRDRIRRLAADKALWLLHQMLK